MTKAEFIELVQKNGGFETKVMAEKAINAFIGAVTEGLTKKESIALVGFGTFSTVDVPEKEGKIPGSDKTYKKAAHVAPKFKFGKTIRDEVAKA